jgi:hypothetical protein
MSYAWLISFLQVFTEQGRFVAVLSLSWPTFAANNTQKESVFPEKAASGALTEKQPRGLNDVNLDGQGIGDSETVNVDSKTGKIDSVTLKDQPEKHDSLAPESKNRNDNLGGERMQSPMFQYLYENVGR